MSQQTTGTLNREDYLYKLRHSTTHVMAQAVQDLFPGTKLTIGPPVDDGFYYDFDSEHRFTPEDLEKIEKRMRAIVEGNHPFAMSTHNAGESRAFWEKRGEKYKVEIIDDLKEPTVTHCSHDAFVDLCRGHHVDTTRDIRHFKLTKIAGAYWRGDEKRERLQRIYGTAWPSEQELKDYLTRLEEAKKRDHRELGPRLGLFSIEHDEGGSGLIYWLPKGTATRRIIEDTLKDYLTAHGYDFVCTPHVARSTLWKTSGHLDYYRDNMYPAMDLENQEFLLKPMNCPGHILIYKSTLHSYRELPLRYAEFGTVYRFERSGVLHGLMRVRGFTQDDAHIFCRPDQVEGEVVEILKIITDILAMFGFKDYDIKLSTRPEKYSGTLEGWAQAEGALRKALETVGLAYTIDPGEGVFYGPKIDLKIKDSLGRQWQCSTVQVDFNNPQRFNITYRDEKGGETQVFMIHRALLGSLERFFGVLIEHYAGAFPLWLAPVQATVLPISEKFQGYADEVLAELKKAGLRATVNDAADKIGAKIREATVQKIPYMLVVGGREAETRAVSLRTRDGKDLGPRPLAEAIPFLRDEVQRRA
ncbi:MAG: threonine--tRNA ligase [Elusimicrobia bacterium]|jgi:threonyl-tRNA synthetase|nr:threonine--tRNA ligase [Elusimicrobiota bacterium]MBK7208622.1 threonine--tRNA ligase [Elusimicrobiota bacterium]MBK7545366.1 threonine--tRNA ligase [Elusimicrobiota bacterium]MBK7575617.1 threonine--tRNA ligase [Elusimicrobiota bacterium]MBK8127052.1 threonine--tRNA ligase [Elusimicrobiota bacterium]